MTRNIIVYDRVAVFSLKNNLTGASRLFSFDGLQQYVYEETNITLNEDIMHIRPLIPCALLPPFGYMTITLLYWGVWSNPKKVVRSIF